LFFLSYEKGGDTDILCVPAQLSLLWRLFFRDRVVPDFNFGMFISYYFLLVKYYFYIFYFFTTESTENALADVQEGGGEG